MNRSVYVLDKRSRSRAGAGSIPARFVLHDTEHVCSALRKAIKGALFVVWDASLLAPLLTGRPIKPSRFDIIWRSKNLQCVAAVKTAFPQAHFYGDVPEFRFLPEEELTDVLCADKSEARDLFIAGVADSETETVALVRGDLTKLLVPFSAFPPSGTGVKPDFKELALTDYGQTLRLGEYEASADAILYEHDADYRRRLQKKRIQEDKTFGAALRRLRLQRQLGRGDFGPLSEKTVSRIERGETPKPHGKTLAVLSNRLGVKPEEIAEY